MFDISKRKEGGQVLYFEGDSFTGKFCRKSISQSVASAGEMGDVTGGQKRDDLKEYVKVEVPQAPRPPKCSCLHPALDTDGGG